MVDERLRGLKDRLLSPLVRHLEGRGVTPLRLTLTGTLFGLAAFLTASLRWWPVALVLWLINRLFDGLDGALARRCGKGSDLGGYLDILADFLVYALLPIGIALGVSSAEHAFPLLVLPGLASPLLLLFAVLVFLTASLRAFHWARGEWRKSR